MTLTERREIKISSEKGYKNYMCDRLGNIYSLKYKRMMNPVNGGAGYKRICLFNSDTKKAKLFSVSRIILTTFNRKPKINEQAAHLDGNKSNNKLSNLIWATPKENDSHKTIHGTVRFGLSHHASKLRKEQVLSIRKDYVKKSRTQSNCKELAKKHGVSMVTIISVVYRRSYRDVL